MFTVTKTYPHSLGLSCVFRQPNAESHCRFLHGYAFAVELVFEAHTLDSNNWVFDFGALKPIKAWLQRTFDHTLMVQRSDPFKHLLEKLHSAGLADIRYVDAIGCESFAKMIGYHVQDFLEQEHPDFGFQRGGRLRSCKVSEHEGNAATWENDL